MSDRSKMMLLEFCKCGASFSGPLPGRPTAQDYENVKSVFWEEHVGHGHGSTTARKCADKRRREEEKLIRADSPRRTYE